jgi:hypothetical protein
MATLPKVLINLPIPNRRGVLHFASELRHTNTLEGYYSIFKRGMKGVYQHCSEKHLHRYVAEFDFRYSNRSKLGIEDVERSEKAISGAAGKRLMYQGPREVTPI